MDPPYVQPSFATIVLCCITQPEVVIQLSSEAEIRNSNGTVSRASSDAYTQARVVILRLQSWEVGKLGKTDGSEESEFALNSSALHQLVILQKIGDAVRQ